MILSAWHHKNVKICKNLQKPRFQLNTINPEDLEQCNAMYLFEKSKMQNAIKQNAMYLFEYNLRVYGWGKQRNAQCGPSISFSYPSLSIFCLCLWSYSKTLSEIESTISNWRWSVPVPYGPYCLHILVGIISFFFMKFMVFSINKIFKNTMVSKTFQWYLIISGITVFRTLYRQENFKKIYKFLMLASKKIYLF